MAEVGPTSRYPAQRAALLVIGALALTGVVVGVLWSWLAPPVHGVVALTRSGERVHVYLGAESDHFFVAAFLMVGLWSVVAVIAAVWAWQWRAQRGPLLAAALALGAALGALVSVGVGTALLHWRFGAVDIDGAPISPEHRVHYMVEAPSAFFGPGPIQMATTLLLPAAIAALVYALFVVAAERDDLGVPAVEAPVPVAPTAEPADGVADVAMDLRVDDAGRLGR